MAILRLLARFAAKGAAAFQSLAIKLQPARVFDQAQQSRFDAGFG
jgi:hypothetical protein